jgi:ribosomal protein L13E
LAGITLAKGIAMLIEKGSSYCCGQLKKQDKSLWDSIINLLKTFATKAEIAYTEDVKVRENSDWHRTIGTITDRMQMRFEASLKACENACSIQNKGKMIFHGVKERLDKLAKMPGNNKVKMEDGLLQRIGRGCYMAELTNAGNRTVVRKKPESTAPASAQSAAPAASATANALQQATTPSLFFNAAGNAWASGAMNVVNGIGQGLGSVFGAANSSDMDVSDGDVTER